MRKPARRGRVLLAVVSCAVLAAGCSSLPMNSDPRALREFRVDSDDESLLAPQPGREPDLLLRDFYTASARPSDNYEAARAYLAPSIRDEWLPNHGVRIVDRLDITPMAVDSDARREFQVNATVIGELSAGGTYTPDNSSYETSVVLEQMDGEWRITGVPNGVLFERTELRNHYEAVRLFYPGPELDVVVPEQRWVYVPQSSSASVLLGLLLQGPSPLLSPAVRPTTGSQATFNGMTDDGAYSFGGFAESSEQERRAFAAQVVWTLSSANIGGPYNLSFEGTNAELRGLTTDDVADYNRTMLSTAATPVYALRGGSLLRLTNNEAIPVVGELGNSGRILSADVRSNNEVAVVQSGAHRPMELAIGRASGEPTVAMEADTLSRPSFEADSDAVWAVADGHSVVRLVRSTASRTSYSRTGVKVNGLDEMEGDISVLRLSPDGLRVALIINGELFTGVVTRDPVGARGVAELVRIAPQLGDGSVSVDWQSDGSLLVGTSFSDTPVWRVEQDGSSAVALPSGNVIAPVVGVAAANTMMFLTDAVSIRQLPADGATTESFWREIPGLRGQRAVPLVAVEAPREEEE